MRGWGNVRANAARSRPPVSLLAAALAVSLLGLGGASVLPASADIGGHPAAPLQLGSGFTGGQSSDGAPAAPADAEPPLQAGGGNLPGQKPVGDAVPDSSISDTVPPLDPGFVDRYSTVWKQIEADKQRIANIVHRIGTARGFASASSNDLQLALRERGRADATLARAEDRFGVSVRNLYITGTTDVDVVLGVMGSEPNDVLANITSFMYLRSNSSSKTDEYIAAQQTSMLSQSAAAQIGIRAAGDQDRIAELLAQLTNGRKRLAKDQKELQVLVSTAAPQTVVGKDGCPKAVLETTVPVDIKVKRLCERAVKHAPTPQAAIAIKYALISLGAPYACEGIGRLEPWRYDCSSYVARAYAEGAGLQTAGDTWAPSTRNMLPWDGVPLDPHYAPIPPAEIKPGDLVLYDTCPEGETCAYRHVVMYLGPMEKDGVPMMAHTNGCGLVAHVEPFLGTDVPNFLGVRRVVALKGEKIHQLFAIPTKPGDKPDQSGKKPAKAEKKP
jgi:cell wall-associated NlpC family hydrolase